MHGGDSKVTHQVRVVVCLKLNGVNRWSCTIVVLITLLQQCLKVVHNLCSKGDVTDPGQQGAQLSYRQDTGRGGGEEGRREREMMSRKASQDTYVYIVGRTLSLSYPDWSVSSSENASSRTICLRSLIKK